MGRPKRRKTSVEAIPEPESEPEIIVDPLEGLRYEPDSPPFEPDVYIPATKRVNVRKKRPLPAIGRQASWRQPSAQVTKPDVPCPLTQVEMDDIILNEDIMLPQALTTFTCKDPALHAPSPVEALRREAPVGQTYINKFKTSSRKEANVFKRIEKVYKEQLKMENHVMSHTGKSRGRLLLRRHQVLPQCEDDGGEKAIFTMERMETPDVIPEEDLFQESLRKEKRGIKPRKTRKEMKYIPVTDWVGCPEVSDGILTLLDKNFRSMRKEIVEHKEETEDNANQNDCVTPSTYIPKMYSLALLGLRYEKAQSALRDSKHKSIIPESHGDFLDNVAKAQIEMRNSGETAECVVYEMKQHTDSRVSLKIGNEHLQWSTDPESASVVRIIEIGCTTDVGNNVINYVFMKNTGTTAVHYNWVKREHNDVFETQRFIYNHFVFDSWGGMILPGEVLKVPFLFKGIEPGYFSEDWKLLTRPLLENGAEIILRLWGLTRQYDPFSRAREAVIEEINARSVQNIVANIVHKIIDFLPLKDVPLLDTRFPLIHLGMDLFHENNPWLHYNTASVYRLECLQDIVDSYKQDTETSASFSGKSNEEDSINPTLAIDVPAGEAEEIEEVIEANTGPELEGTHSQMVAIAMECLKKTLDFDDPQLKLCLIQVPPEAVPEETEDGCDIQSPPPPPHPKAPINLTKCNIVVEELRNDILNTEAPLSLQEAFFEAMAKDVDKLLFRTEVAKIDRKHVMCRTMLCQVMDSFSDFAIALQKSCLQGQATKLKQEEIAEAEREICAVEDIPDYDDIQKESDVEEPVPPETKKKSIKRNKKSLAKEDTDKEEVDTGAKHSIVQDNIPTLETSSEESCGSALPRHALSSTRFSEVFYPALHGRMYQCVTDFVNSMAHILEEDKEIKLDVSQLTFQRVVDIPMSVKTEHMLEAPLPPKWVALAQRLDETEASIRRHRQEVEEQEDEIILSLGPGPKKSKKTSGTGILMH